MRIEEIISTKDKNLLTKYVQSKGMSVVDITPALDACIKYNQLGSICILTSLRAMPIDFDRLIRSVKASICPEEAIIVLNEYYKENINRTPCLGRLNDVLNLHNTELELQCYGRTQASTDMVKESVLKGHKISDTAVHRAACGNFKTFLELIGRVDRVSIMDLLCDDPNILTNVVDYLIVHADATESMIIKCMNSTPDRVECMIHGLKTGADKVALHSVKINNVEILKMLMGRGMVSNHNELVSECCELGRSTCLRQVLRCANINLTPAQHDICIKQETYDTLYIAMDSRCIENPETLNPELTGILDIYPDIETDSMSVRAARAISAGEDLSGMISPEDEDKMENILHSLRFGSLDDINIDYSLGTYIGLLVYFKGMFHMKDLSDLLTQSSFKRKVKADIDRLVALV